MARRLGSPPHGRADAGGLDLDAARAALAAGRPLRVTLGPATGLPEQTRGTVVRIDDPAVSAECVVVRVGGDDLPFAPGEVTLAGPRRRDVLRLQPDPELPELPGLRTPAPIPPPEPLVPVAALAAAESYAAGAPTAAAAPPTAPTRPAPPAPVLAAVPTPLEPPPAGAASGAAPARGAERAPTGRRPGRRAAPRLEISLRHGEEGWSVAAASGARTLLRPQPVEPGAAVALVDALDTPAVSALVADIVDKARVEAVARVEALAAQLAAAEAELQSYGSPPRRSGPTATRS